MLLGRIPRSSIPKNYSRLFGTAFESRNTVSYLVIDGYAKDGREELVKGGASEAGILYKGMLEKCTPVHCEVDIVYPAEPNFSFPNLDKYDSVAWTGCSLTVHNKEDTRVIPQIEFAKYCYEYGIPQFGSCWAAQIAAVAAGGICARNPLGREMGISRKIMLTPEGRSHPMFEGKPAVFDAYTSHEDEITHLPPTGLNLCGNFFTNIQAIAIRHLNGDFWAVQYHPEYNLHELARLTHCRREKLIKLGLFSSMIDADKYVEDLSTLHEDPSRYDIAWRLGIDADVMSDNLRLCEVRNFIKYLVLPYKENKNINRSVE